MKIAFFIPDFHGGGAEHMVINMANEFTRRGYAVDLLALHTNGHYKNIISAEVRVVSLNKTRALTAIPALARYMRKEKPDIFLSAMPHLNIVTLLSRVLAFQKKTATVITERNFFSISLKNGNVIKNKVMIALVRCLYPLADKIVGISEGVAKDIAGYIPGSEKKVIWIHNPVITDETMALLDEAISDPWLDRDDSPVLITSGRLVPQKDQKTLLEAFALLRRNKAARLIILGDGPLRAELQSQALALGIGNDIYFPGFVENPIAYMKKSSLFVMSSAWEGFCNVIVEALLCGLPVVSTDCPSGPAEILDHGAYGLLTPVGNAAALARAMEFSLNQKHDPEKQKRRAMDFTAQKICDRYEEAFKGLLEKPA